jgi:hypothetical protein
MFLVAGGVVIAIVACGGFIVALLLPAARDYGGQLSRPSEAHVDLSDDTLNKFDAGSRDLLLRYLAGNSRWEISEEEGVKYAVRREKVKGAYETTLNGFYPSPAGDSHRQTRVILSFGNSHGFGRERGNITRATAGAGDVATIIEEPHVGSPGNSSYLIIRGTGLFLEIYEQSPEAERVFTKAAWAEVCSELRDVLAHLDDIRSEGRVPIESRYPPQDLADGEFRVDDGMQPGIYLLKAMVNPTAKGSVYVKVFDASTGQRLSADRITRRSKRIVNWSDDGSTYSAYHAEFTVYEGDWSTKYQARFEIWHQPESGPETKLAEATRLINGWQR